MTKELFLKTLRQRLYWDLPEERIELETQKYITFFEKGDGEKSQEELVAECGDINLIADEIISEYKAVQNASVKKKKGFVKRLDTKTKFIITLVAWLLVYVFCMLHSFGGMGVGISGAIYQLFPNVFNFFREVSGNFLTSLLLFLIPCVAVFITMCSRDRIDEKMNMKKVRAYYLINILIIALMALVVWTYTILPMFRMVYGEGPFYEGVPFVNLTETSQMGGILSSVLISCMVISTLLGILSGAAVSKLGMYCLPFTFIYASITAYISDYRSLLQQMDDPATLMAVFLETHNILLLGIACAIMAFVTVYIARRELV